MSFKSSNTNTNTTNNLNVKLQFDKDEFNQRTWVNKDGFDGFESEYREYQDDGTLANTSSVEFEIHVKMVKVETKKEETKKIWIPSTTVYGGANGVKLYIKHKIIEMVYAYEDSDWEIISMGIVKLYTQQKKTRTTSKIQRN